MQKSARLKAIDISRDTITLEPKKNLHDARNSLVRYNISRIVAAQGKQTSRNSYRERYRSVFVHPSTREAS